MLRSRDQAQRTYKLRRVAELGVAGEVAGETKLLKSPLSMIQPACPTSMITDSSGVYCDASKPCP